MPNNVQNIDRFLAAYEGGSGVYPRDVMDWLANSFQEFKRCPATGLGKAFGIQRPSKAECKREVRKHLQRHFSEYERLLGKTKNKAAGDIDTQLQALGRNYDDPNVPPQYRQLFDKISGLGERMPGDVTIRKILGKN